MKPTKRKIAEEVDELAENEDDRSALILWREFISPSGDWIDDLRDGGDLHPQTCRWLAVGTNDDEAAERLREHGLDLDEDEIEALAEPYQELDAESDAAEADRTEK